MKLVFLLALGLAACDIKGRLDDRAGLVLDPVLTALTVVGVGDHIAGARRVGVRDLLQEVAGRDLAVAGACALGRAIGVGGRPG